MGSVSHPGTGNREPTQVREARHVCRRLTLDLFLRRGDFWQHVRTQRHRVQYAAYRRDLNAWTTAGGWCPDDVYFAPSPRRCPGCLRCARPDRTDDAPRAVPPSLFDPERRILSPIHAFREIGPEGRAIERSVHDLYYQHERDFGHVPSMVRQAFLAGCVRFDPPRDRLEAYADHALEWCIPTRPLSEYWSAPIQEAAARGMPVEWVPRLADFAVAVSMQEREQGDAHMAALKDALREELSRGGLDADAIIGRAEANVLPHLSRHMAAIQSTYSPGDAMRAATPCIRLTPLTSEDDVRQAYRFVRSRCWPEDTRTKPKRDPLVAVQCAILYDELSWSHARIGERYGWAVEARDYAKDRCETARAHIAGGRSIRRQKKVAA